MKEQLYIEDLVSIVMFSHDSSKYVEESVRSVLTQTYNNWELIVVDDNSKDDTINKLMILRDEVKDRIKLFGTVFTNGESSNRNSALSKARGKWVAFLNIGDTWAPEKLEKQIKFMKEHDYSFTYHSYGLMNEESKNLGVVINGKEHITYHDMLRCCWPAYMTVLYDAEKIGKIRVNNLKSNNDYALWLNICEKSDCYLLNDNLATKRIFWGRLGNWLKTDKVKWRYEVYCDELGFKPVKSFFCTIRNGCYGILKWIKYVKKG